MEVHNPECGCQIRGTHDYGDYSYIIGFCLAHEIAPETAAERDRLLLVNAELLTVATNLVRRTLDFAEAEPWPEVEATLQIIASAHAMIARDRAATGGAQPCQ